MPEIRLKIHRSPTEFRTETFHQARISMGREINNDIVVAERDVSRFHCVVECNEEGWRIVDLESTNGTFVNGISVKKSPLKAGDVIVVGATRLHVIECQSAATGNTATIGSFRVVQMFDGRELLHPQRRKKAEAAAPAAARQSGSPAPARGDGTTPSPGPRASVPLVPVLTADEVLRGAGDPRSLAQAVAVRVLSLYDADACLVQACDAETQQVRWTVVEPAFENIVVPREILNYVRERKIAIHLQSDIEQSPKPGRRSMRAIMCAPILDGSSVLGAMALVRFHVAWRTDMSELEAVSAGALATGSALACARRYGDLERAYLGLLEAGEAIPSTFSDRQQDEAEAILLDSATQRLREEIGELRRCAEQLASESTQTDGAGQAIAEMARAARRSQEIADRISAIAEERRDLPGVTHLPVLLAALVPLLRDLCGPNVAISESAASELPPVAVNARVLRAALTRLILFCRDRVHAGRVALSIEMCGLEESLEIVGYDSIPPGHYVVLTLEAEGDPAAVEDLRGFRDDDSAIPRDPRSRGTGLYWASRALRRAAARLLIRQVADRLLAFDLYLPAAS
jgi:hypothetical protein